ncbi:MAG: ABC transporter permease subunit, partial [Odoribacteraceae bacterium]|nr:ABC transporter permease subunit [Odoribacteraceae bacterium]
MKIIRKIALTELQALFYSPVAWLILIVFTFQAAMAFTDVFGMYVRNQDLNYPVGNLTLNLFGGMRGLFTNVQGYLYLYIPLLTMSLMSRELSSGSINLLYSSPVKNSQIILGKYASMLAYGLVMLAILFVFVLLAAFTVKDFDFPVALSGMLGLYLLICAYAAIGLFMSSLTSYQVVAAMGTLAMLSLLNFVGRFGQEYDFVREITYWLSIGGRASESINGLICSEDVLYFVIVAGLFLALSILRLKAIRQKSRWQVSCSKYVGVFVVAMLLGYATSRPRLMAFHDATRTKQRTLTENSQDIIKRADGGLTMTTYVNGLGGDMWSGLPRSRKYDVDRFAQYIRFKPEMKIKYVYYYT